jgi:HAD superfamily hydrolase (TIGR01484 family)
MRVTALFSDYDGTLSPLEAQRQDAAISPRLRRLLVSLSKKIPFGIVSTKDLDFIRKRVPFVHAISAISGLEMQIGETIITDKRVPSTAKKVEQGYQEVLPKILAIGDQVVIERKTTENDELIAFCIDWRLSQNWTEAQKKVRPIISRCKDMDLCVGESENSPFVNIYGVEVDKGSALEKLRTELGINGPITYLGDSEADNPAFDLAEVSIGIKHQRKMPELTCKYQLEFFELESFILKLLDAEFEFSADMVHVNPSYGSSKRTKEEE